MSGNAFLTGTWELGFLLYFVEISTVQQHKTKDHCGKISAIVHYGQTEKCEVLLKNNLSEEF